MMKRERKRIVGLHIFFILGIVSCLFIKAEDVDASTLYKTIYTYSDVKKDERTIGKTVFETKGKDLYAIKNGKRVLIVSDKNHELTISSNGNSVYYCIMDNKKMMADIYCVSSIGKEPKKVLSVDYDMFCFIGYYKGKIYYRNGNDFSKKGCNLYSCSLKTKKEKRVVKNVGDSTEQYGQYFYSLPYIGDNWYTAPLRLYNGRNGKVKTVCKKCPTYRCFDGNLYFLQVNREIPLKDGTGFDVSLKKCDIDGTGKKTLIKSLKIKYYHNLTKNSLTYYDLKGKKRKKNF